MFMYVLDINIEDYIHSYIYIHACLSPEVKLEMKP